ncbi:hypothetical protein B0H11DRAFT_1734080 [Mycena galericulata]|nr:hypothetical protein B0H11DRAFT_1734080 [Mycena galericulata]
MDAPLRKVYLPLKKLKKCDACSKTITLRLCAACGERTYCSPKCQKQDWPTHKPICGKTDRIDLETFYPFLACLADMSHMRQEDKPIHPAMTHSIVNSPNPGSHPARFPDGSAAKLVLLGEPIDAMQLGSPKWWPTALSDKVRSKLLRRIVREGYTLPVVTSICLALLAEMYTTTAVSAAASPDGKLQRRTRLTYKSSPIADFGVAAGSADVKNQDKLAYFKISENLFVRGQDPDDHYWIYFTTIRGEDILLDCAMFTFNMCLLVNARPYLPRALGGLEFVPAFFRERTIDRHTPNLHIERTRVSVLRNADMNRAVGSLKGFSGEDKSLVCGFMEALARRPLSDTEIELTFKCANLHCSVLAATLETRAWASWPAPEVGIEGDPGELDDLKDDGEDDEEWFKYMKAWRSKYKKGNADREALGIAFREWEARNAEKKRK